ncbi:153_t:CDS:2 [Paraglomus brasilianum]|uniref:153_t:CDS:1 n=1 Tax=Paraglomus brasilianum TaxID=144538 RepID=A0A9N9D9R5_9GLOM|nr:153_t:CDS:2 [Paraglomus brasilianum]
MSSKGRVQGFLKNIFSSRKQRHKVSRVPRVKNSRSLPNLRQNAPSTGTEPPPDLCPFCQKPQKRPKWCEQCQEFPPPVIESDTDCESTSHSQPAQGDASNEIPYGICRKCYYPKTSQWWCNYCESLAFQAEFGKWSSGNEVIDEMIRKSQLNAADELNYLEWVNYDEFEDVQLVVESELGKLYTAIWKTGPRIKYNQDLGEWMRDNDITIALKELNDSTNMTDDYIRKIEQYASCNTTGSNILQCFGLTFNPVTKNYLLIIDYCEHGNLNQYLDKHHADITWERRLAILHSLSAAVFNLHEKNIFHQNLHGGNILMGLGPPMIADVGLCIPAYECSDTKNVYGVLPFVAPEVLRGSTYTAAADVYSLGMLMWQLASGRPPFHNRAHDMQLSIDIRNRIKPKVINGIPECYQEFMERCWNDDPGERPTSSEVYSIVGIWFNQMMFVPGSEIGKQFWEAEDFRKYHNVSEDMNDDKHPKASYGSRLLSFPEIFYDDVEINGTNSEQTRIEEDSKSSSDEHDNETLYTGVVADEVNTNEKEEDLPTTPKKPLYLEG